MGRKKGYEREVLAELDSAALLAELQPAAGAVFKTCKSCHEGYRVDD